MTVFYRKYRPQRLSEVIGQKHVTSILLSQLEEGKIGHGYLFAGPRGTGKTSMARIVAKAVNCDVYSLRTTDYSKKKNSNRQKAVDGRLTFGEPCNKCNSCLAILDGSHLDLIEIDAASNRGIEEIRDLREKVKLAPVSGRFKVYIIDEAHMLTPEAFNAFLKTLEEPPAHAIFILCTTNPAKLPLTIISRLQRFNFSRATDADLVEIIKKIAKNESVKISDAAISAIAKASDGSYRDAVSILDQLAVFKKEIKEEDILNLAVISGWNQLYDFVENLARKRVKEAVLTIEEISQTGADVSLFTREVILFLEKLLFLKIGISPTGFDLDDSQFDKLKNLAGAFTSSDLQNLMKLFLVAEGEMKSYPLPQISLVLAVCKYWGSDGQVSKGNQYLESKKDTTENDILPARRGTGLPRAGSDDVFSSASSPTMEDRGIRGFKNKLPEVPAPKETKDAKTKVRSQKSVKSLRTFEKHWQEFLDKVKPLNAHVVALLRSTRPRDFDGVNLTLEVFYRFHKEKLEEPKIMTMLGEILEKVVGKPINLKFVLADRKTSKPAAVAASNVIDINEYELEDVVSEIFSKQ